MKMYVRGFDRYKEILNLLQLENKEKIHVSSDVSAGDMVFEIVVTAQ